MHFVDVDPYDEAQLETVTRLVEAARVIDDPDFPPVTVEDTRADARYGTDLHPARFALLLDEAGDAVGHLWTEAPVHENLRVVMAELTVRPDRRGLGCDQLMLDEVVRRTRVLGRDLIWVGTVADDVATTGLLEANGFSLGSTDARRHQVLAEVDLDAVERLEAEALDHSRDYLVERLDPPYDDGLLEELVAATNAINDAPMGSLDFEDEIVDLRRMLDQESARAQRGARIHRVVARHRETHEIAGHTFLAVRPWAPDVAFQWDTAVARGHRGHRLGLLLKIAMMRWLVDDEPQVETVVTWNNVDNAPMISVNELIGYRLSRELATYQTALSTDDEEVRAP